MIIQRGQKQHSFLSRVEEKCMEEAFKKSNIFFDEIGQRNKLLTFNFCITI